MSETIDAAGIDAWLRVFARAVAERRDELTALDAAIGDADHGVNMDRGLQAVLGKLDERAAGDAAGRAAGDAAGVSATAVDASGEAVGALLKTVGMTLVSTVGGAAGPLYGTLFLRMATAAGDVATLTLPEWSTAFAAGVAGVQARGKAEPGDKTMVDTLAPAAAALEAAASEGVPAAEALRRAAAAGQQGMVATIPLVARKGRASYLGQRSAGTQDPGATSSWLLLEAAVALVAVTEP
jgi:dihydroxyacetone kinase-like protein